LHSNNHILNHGLSLALEFGAELNQPIHQRLLIFYTNLTNAELNQLNEVCYEVRDLGHAFLLEVLKSFAATKTRVTAIELMLTLYSYLLSKYLWINEKNLKKLYSQACYYAYKDGLIEVISD